MKKKYFITGGTGSFGKAFIYSLIKKKLANKIIIYSRDEFKQSQLQQLPWIKKNKKIFRFFIGDVRDEKRLLFAMDNEIDIVIHTAALKQVPLIEYNPFEAIKTNIIGSQNIIQCALQTNVKKVISLSTDKASSPINLYGATKLAADKLFVSSNSIRGKKKTIFSVVRYGNVLGSRGSVIPVFLKQSKNNIFKITDKRMTRFSITLGEAVNFVHFCVNLMKGGEVFVPKIPSYNIIDVAKAINPKAKIIYSGIRPGEKLHEEMISFNDSINVREFKNYFIIDPFKEKKQCKPLSLFSYNSQNNHQKLTVAKIKELIKKNLKFFEN